MYVKDVRILPCTWISVNDFLVPVFLRSRSNGVYNCWRLSGKELCKVLTEPQICVKLHLMSSFCSHILLLPISKVKTVCGANERSRRDVCVSECELGWRSLAVDVVQFRSYGTARARANVESWTWTRLQSQTKSGSEFPAVLVHCSFTSLTVVRLFNFFISLECNFCGWSGIFP